MTENPEYSNHINSAFDEGETPPSAARPCPVQPLGWSGTCCYFLTPSGYLFTMTQREFNIRGILMLFEGDQQWLRGKFPRRDSRGTIVSFDNIEATAWLIKHCAKLGFFDPRFSLRNAGVWKGSDGNLIVHCGDAVWAEGGWTEAGFSHDGYVYPLTPRGATLG